MVSLLAGNGDLVVNLHGVLPATVRLAPMGNPDHQDDQLVVQQLVQNAVVAHPLAAQTAQSPFSELPASGCSRRASMASITRSLASRGN